ncbi:MAG: NUDIX hydrolase [Proteobacteria bacterium]|nr:NUDIX hydrolase [Pseudomonadota bacterium]
MKYCNQCGSKLAYRIPDDDDRARFICDACQIIHYQNPKMVVGCIRVWEDLAFTVVREVLRRYYRDSLKGVFPFYMDDILADAIKP